MYVIVLFRENIDGSEEIVKVAAVTENEETAKRYCRTAKRESIEWYDYFSVPII